VSKLCIIKQPAGLGDIFFCQKIADQLIQKEYKVVWPIIEHFKWLPKYIQKQNIEYPLVTSTFKYKELFNDQTPVINRPNFLFLPLQTASKWVTASTFMEAKYNLVGGTSVNWQSHFKIHRNKEREQKLFKYFGINKQDKFTLVNRNFASPPDIQKNLNIKPNSNHIVEVDFLGWDNIFDWCGLIEAAEEIHTVETSFCYIIEKVNTSKKLFMYSRNGQHENFDYIKSVFNKPWNYMI